MTDQVNPEDGHSAVRFVSPYPFQATSERLEQAIEAAGMTIFARVDHAAAARAIGMAMPPTLVLLYGNPHGGTPIMVAAPDSALDLPLRVLLREEPDGRTIMAFHPIARLLQDAGVPSDLAARLRPAQHLLVKALQS